MASYCLYDINYGNVTSIVDIYCCGLNDSNSYKGKFKVAIVTNESIVVVVVVWWSC